MSSYTEATARNWLAWVARELQARSATVFLIEDLQPACLAGRAQYLAYLVLSRVPITLVLTFLGVWLFEGNPAPLKVQWPVIAACWSVAVVMLGATDAAGWWDTVTRRGRAARWMAVFGCAGLFTWAWYRNAGGMPLGLPDSTFMYPVYGLVLAGGGPRGSRTEVRVVESVGWSWRRAFPPAATGAGMAALGFWNTAMCEGPEALCGILELGGQPLADLGLVTLAFGALRGLRPGLPGLKTSPNQGIRTTVALAGGVTAGVVLTVFAPVVLASWFVPGYSLAGLGGGGIVPFALLVAASAVLHLGGRDAIRHASLRTILWATGVGPLRMARFLDYAARDLQLLQRVGGGYIFIHRMMLEHFARYQTAGSGSSATRSQPVGSQSASVR